MGDLTNTRTMRTQGRAWRFAATALLVGLVACAPAAEQEAKFAPRIPVKFFRTVGAGTSWDGVPPSPYETFSYDAALLEAGIQDFNVVEYTSVLPKEVYGNEVPRDSVASYFHPGSVLEVIMAHLGDQVYAKEDPVKGQFRSRTLVAGVGMVWAADPALPTVLRNGYAAEYEFSHHPPVSEDEAKKTAIEQLDKSLDHELSIRGLVELEGTERQYELKVLQLNYKKGTEQYGYCLSALGFVEFEFPAPYPAPARGGS